MRDFLIEFGLFVRINTSLRDLHLINQIASVKLVQRIRWRLSKSSKHFYLFLLCSISFSNTTIFNLNYKIWLNKFCLKGYISNELNIRKEFVISDLRNIILVICFWTRISCLMFVTPQEVKPYYKCDCTREK